MSGNLSFGIYIHLPFCRSKCTFCDFNAYAGQKELYGPYVDALVLEIEGAHARLWPEHATNALQARTVYFGGGTPSLMPVQAIARVLDAVHHRFIVPHDLEVSLEANPGTVDASYLEGILEAGVNRLSLGFETLDDNLLKLFRRGHTAVDALEAFRLAREAGFTNINVDLMYALPGQTLQDWQRDLSAVLELEPEHISAYQLTVHKGTVLHRQVAQGIVDLPDADLAADMYLVACDMLATAGYEHYEIANWGRRPCIHNLIYWHREPYMGFGAGAHSLVNHLRYWNVASPSAYIAKVLAEGIAVDGVEELSKAVADAEVVILALRLREGIAETELVGLDNAVRYRASAALLNFSQFGLADTLGGRWRLTERGWLVANCLFERLLP